MTCLQEKPSTTHNITSFKKLISLHFSIAANSYDKYATIQHTVAKKLYQLATNYVAKNIAIIADLGCGTGRETRLLARYYKQSTIIGVDIATEMLQKASNIPSKNIHWCRADIEDLPLKPNCISLFFSNLALQWCDLASVLNKSYSTLMPGGYFIFSTLCAGSLSELKHAWNSINEANRVNDYFSKDKLVDVINGSPFVIKNILYDKHISFYPNVISLLKSLKYQGVNTIYHTEGKLTSRSNLQKLIQSYSKLQTDCGIPLSYQVAKVVLKKVG
jgi:malonyl-CoA O-methyltransferase